MAVKKEISLFLAVAKWNENPKKDKGLYKKRIVFLKQLIRCI